MYIDGSFFTKCSHSYVYLVYHYVTPLDDGDLAATHVTLEALRSTKVAVAQFNSQSSNDAPAPPALQVSLMATVNTHKTIEALRSNFGVFPIESNDPRVNVTLLVVSIVVLVSEWNVQMFLLKEFLDVEFLVKS